MFFNDLFDTVSFILFMFSSMKERNVQMKETFGKKSLMFASFILLVNL